MQAHTHTHTCRKTCAHSSYKSGVTQREDWCIGKFFALTSAFNFGGESVTQGVPPRAQGQSLHSLITRRRKQDERSREETQQVGSRTHRKEAGRSVSQHRTEKDRDSPKPVGQVAFTSTSLPHKLCLGSQWSTHC